MFFSQGYTLYVFSRDWRRVILSFWTNYISLVKHYIKCFHLTSNPQILLVVIYTDSWISYNHY